MTKKIRLTVVMTHPIQYYSPWFRFIASEVPELDLTVLYVSEPSPRQQGVQFGVDFVWDVPLRDGYDSDVLRPARIDDEFGSEHFWGIDAPKIGAAIEGTRPDAVVLSGWHSASLVRALFACRRRGIPAIYRGDTNLGGRGRSLSWRLRTRFLLSRFDRYLSVGVRAREYLQHFGVADTLIHDSPHAVDNEFFAQRARPFRDPKARAEARAVLEIPEHTFVVLFVGKLEAKKRLEDLLRALTEVGPPTILVAVGSGPLESSSRKLASDLGVDVRWCGFLNQTELGRAHGSSDCLVLPSGWGETWGLVVNEAMAAGLPCVVSDRVGCGPDLVIRGRTGEIFPYGDHQELAAAIERVRSDANRSPACQEHVRRFSFDAATQGLLTACRELVT
jgi:glycosyltransferase involved in cell wall biosynthesis